MTFSFVHDTLGQRVMLGAGRAREFVAGEVDRLGGARVMVIASSHERELADPVVEGLPVALSWEEVRQHVPVENAERARAAADEHDVDVLLSIGGGSTTGLAKAVALTSGRPIVAVPTTYAGSEATNVWGLTESGVKKTGVHPQVLPVSVVYDAELTFGLPADLSVASGLNGLAHCVDALWAPRADPINQALGLEGTRALAEGLPAVLEDPTGIAGRDRCLYGAYLAAVAFTSAGSAMHHKICHVLGGAYDLPHAQTHAIVLPYVLAFNAPSVPREATRLAQALGASVAEEADGPKAALDALNDLRERLDAPHALRDHGLAEKDITDAVRRVSATIPDSNPTPVTDERLESLLRSAWAGDTPTLRS